MKVRNSSLVGAAIIVAWRLSASQEFTTLVYQTQPLRLLFWMQGAFFKQANKQTKSCVCLV